MKTKTGLVTDFGVMRLHPSAEAAFASVPTVKKQSLYDEESFYNAPDESTDLGRAWIEFEIRQNRRAQAAYVRGADINRMVTEPFF